MVNVVGVGVGGSGQQQRGVLSLTDFIGAIPLEPPSPPDTVLQLQLHKPNTDNQTQLDNSAPPYSNNKMTARATLQCRTNSHPFHERSLLLDSPVKIGRSVARSRPCNTNSIFDCKVLSRNHALLWYEDGKFYLQDTKSSNGTFVNNQRLSKGSEESAPREVCSGDIVQFGVDVMENSRKVTHGCIIATLRLYMPDGQEAKASPSLSVTGLTSEAGVEVQQLRTCLQEAHYREAAIQSKLQALAAIIQATQDAANQSWSAMIGEDRLLQKLEMMEAQLATYAKNWPEDRLREEVRRLHEEKCQYESHVKESLARMLGQKCQALTRLADAERSLASSESELSQLRVVAESSQQQLTELLEQQATHTQQVATLQQQLQAAETQLKECPAGVSEQGEAGEEQLQLQCLKKQFADKCSKEEQLLAQVESASAEADFTKQQLAAVQARYGVDGGGQEGADEQSKDGGSSNSGGVVTGEQRLLAARLKQYQLELNSGQAQLAAVLKDVAAAEKAEERQLEEKRRLEEELAEARCRAEASSTLLHHLHHTITSLHNMLHRAGRPLPPTSVMPDLVSQNSLPPSSISTKRLDTPRADDIIAEKNSNNARICGSPNQEDNARICGSPNQEDNARICGSPNQADNARICGSPNQEDNSDEDNDCLTKHNEDDDDIVASNNDINASNNKAVRNDTDANDSEDDKKCPTQIPDVNGEDGLHVAVDVTPKVFIAGDEPPKIYDDLYEDYTATITRKKDPSADDDRTGSKKKDELPEKEEKESEKKKTDQEDSEQEGKVEDKIDKEEMNKEKFDDNNEADVNSDEEEMDSVSTETTLTLLDNTVVADGQCPTVGGGGVLESEAEQCVTRLVDHLARLQELRVSTSSKDAAASEEVVALREQLQHATTAAQTASHETKALKASLSSAEKYATGRASVVSELQQSAARLGAAGTIIKQQLEQLNTQLVQQRQMVAEERGKGLQLQERLQEAEALAAEGVQQTEALNRQLQQLKTRAAQDTLSTAVSKGAGGEEVAVAASEEAQPSDKTEASGQEELSIEQSKPEESKSSLEVGELEEQMKLAVEMEERKRASEKELQVLEKRVQQLQGELDQLREQRRLQLQQLQADTLKKRDSGYDGEGLVNSEEKTGEKASSCDGGPADATKVVDEDVSDGATLEAKQAGAALLASSASVQEELQAVQRECEELQARLSSRDEDFTMLTLQNKTAFALSVVPLFVLLLAFVTAFHDCLASLTGTHDFT